ncbi:hypothetical protein QA648_33480 (plasmid) [Rhizobium sp. CB3171]|uniref:hypothetical protein n=1 Tax=Rhizobium sp. CB3171 TaxID=3039157 RepID=UPI0024B099FD|nr:hypothetical protein [Rhizobium sp. CB3171]WFU06709.1 hypothetical protein QA648_33480 [Rhizobium sp. CB3171]
MLPELATEEKELVADEAIEALPDTILAIGAYWRIPNSKKPLCRPASLDSQHGLNDPSRVDQAKKSRNAEMLRDWLQAENLTRNKYAEKRLIDALHLLVNRCKQSRTVTVHQTSHSM